MSKTTRKELFEEFKKTGEFSCPFCLRTDFECLEDLAQHIEIDHQYEIQETEEGLSKIAKENKEVLENWVTERKRELLLEIAEENPRLLHEIQGTHGDEIIDREIEMDLFKKALKTNTLSSFDAMWIQHPRFEEIYRATREKPEHKPDPQSGQTEEYFESPDAMIATTKTTNIRGKETLSEEDKARRKMVLVLTALLRNKKKAQRSLH